MKQLSILLIVLFALTLIFSTAFKTPIAADTVGASNEVAPKHLSLSDCVFFGDSTTYGLLRYNAHNNGRFGDNYYSLQDSQIWTPKSGTFYLGNLTNLKVYLPSFGEVSLKNALTQIQPRVFVITVGINGLASWERDLFLKYYERLVQSVKEASPDTLILLQSIYPIAETAKESLPHFTNEKIDLVNTWISDFAKADGYFYLDTARILKNEHGTLAESYHNGDGLHLSTKGFNQMLQNVDHFLSFLTMGDL